MLGAEKTPTMQTATDLVRPLKGSPNSKLFHDKRNFYVEMRVVADELASLLATVYSSRHFLHERHKSCTHGAYEESLDA